MDSISPELGLFGDLSFTHEGGSEWIEPGYAAYDIRDGNLTDQVTISGNLDVSVTGQYELTYEITDAAGNTANVTRVVEVEDTTAPVITLFGDDTTEHEAGGLYTDLGANWTDIVDGDGDTVSTGEVDVYVPGTYEIIYNYTDSSGNEALTVVRTVEVMDTTAPVITLNGLSEVTHEAGGLYTDLGANWTDIVDGDGDAVSTGEVDVYVPGTYEIIYNYTDSSGNEALPVVRTVEVMDTTAPVITLNGLSEVTHEAGGVYTDLGANWTDIVDGDGDAVSTGEVDVYVPGTYEIIYNYTDSSGNEALRVVRTVEVMDTTAPVITLNGLSEVTHEAGGVYTDLGANWTDIVDGEGDAESTGEVDVYVPGTYEIIYNYTDSSGNEALRIVRTVEVMDTTAPVITLNGLSEVAHEAGGVYTDLGANWTDIVDGDGDAVSTGEVDVYVPGTYEIIYNYTDSSGNEALRVVRTVEVMDTTAPVITLNGLSEVTHEAGFPYYDANATWLDVVDGSGVIYPAGELNINIPGIYILSYDFIDSNGNVAETVTREVTVYNTAPENLEVLSSLAVEENKPSGSVVGQFTAMDRNGDFLTYHLIDGLGSDDNHLFVFYPRDEKAFKNQLDI